jgi:hypothetical protein
MRYPIPSIDGIIISPTKKCRPIKLCIECIRYFSIITVTVGILGSGAGQTSSRCCIVWSNNVNPGFTHDHYLEGTSTINKPWLVGGFNHLETYYSMGRIIPYIKENERWLKPPTRWFLNPGLILSKPETQSCHHCHHIPSRSRSTAQPCLLGFRTDALKIHGIGMR